MLVKSICQACDPFLFGKSNFRKLSVGENFKLYDKYSRKQNTEMKRFHGMGRARGYGLRSLRMQVKLLCITI